MVPWWGKRRKRREMSWVKTAAPGAKVDAAALTITSTTDVSVAARAKPPLASISERLVKEVLGVERSNWRPRPWPPDHQRAR